MEETVICPTGCIRTARSVKLLVIALTAVLHALPSRAEAQRCDPRIARAVSVEGTVESRPAGEADWRSVGMGDEFCAGDQLRVGPNSRADVSLLDQSVLRIRAGTELTLSGLRSGETSLVDLLRGAAHFFTRKGAGSLEVNTPFTVAGVRGTEFYVAVEPEQTLLSVFEGSVLAANSLGQLALSDGQSAVARPGKAPELQLVARPRDAVRWALYYPPVLYVAPTPVAGEPGWLAQMRSSSEAYLRGDLAQAFARIEGLSERDVSDPRFFSYRASLSLAAGGVEEAEQDLARARALAPDDADALALQSVLAVVGDQRDAALELAQRAVRAGPRSSSARIALSYARQAAFDLEGARAALEESVTLAPDDALAWARLAEIRSSLGDVEGASAAAQRAVELAPDLSRTQTVKGFALLSEVEPESAQAAFERAIQSDPADPLPRLGLGLARIRQGELSAGARDLEVAASLDSANALVRSYLGKAYFEEKRDGLDLREFSAAQKLDPNDPTAWLYSAIAKQTTNRPVEALRDLRHAIELNDQRAVYRSRLLLDSDLAARSASLGRIYGDLGFQSLALVEGWNSLAADPSSYSAHRLLADSYAALPRHEIARVSELLQSQLLQPANLTPIQPRLAESNLQLISAQGPSALSFNEFNPLFSRDGTGVQASGLFGEDDTQSGEGIVSGIDGPFSFSAGYSGYTTDGFRANGYQRDRIANLFAQYEVSHRTGLQAEVRHRQTRNGDLELRFLEDDFSRFSDEENDTNSLRAGLRHELSPNSTLLVSAIYQDLDTRFDDFVPDPLFPFSIDLDVEEEGGNVEGQYLYRSAPLGDWLQDVKLVAGGGYSGVDSTQTTTSVVGPFPPDIVGLEPDLEHSNAYLYTQLGLPGRVTLTAGWSGDFFDQDDGVGDENQGNPKLGILWNPAFLSGTTLRAAVFRTLVRTLVTQQTLEPTQVAGFNQFFDDPPGTDAWRYGGAIDQRLGERVSGGVEFSKRSLEVPQALIGGGSSVVQRFDWDENLARGYLLWTPYDWVALRAEYQRERVERPREALFAFEEVVTHRLPLGLQLFHESGAGFSLVATYVDQDGTFLRNSTATFERGDTQFWVIDAALRYRLPRRRGFVTVGARDLLDEAATYQATDVRNPDLRPGRFIFASITLDYP